MARLHQISRFGRLLPHHSACFSTAPYGSLQATYSLQNGHPLHYTTHGPENAAATFVLLHGAPGSHMDFKHLAPLLVRDNVNVLAFDLPGNGQTPAAAAGGMASLTAGALADVVVEAIDGLSLQRAFVLGHSCGGHTAIEVADRIKRVAGIALLNSMGLRPHQAIRPFAPIQFGAQKLRTPGFQRDVCVAINHWVYMNIYKFPKRTPRDDMTYAFQRSGTTDFDKIGRHVASLGRRKVPSLVAIALDDVLVEKAIGHELGALLHPGVRLDYNRGGHNIQKTQCGVLAEALLTWAQASV
ncbi:hypothetical protein SDRG_02423 [Saprolegnia diclina VS20]|uniref:AB hydrolase-1 domain-containing protein n=1 Tax=Saprolegnia diclina (strain VS20) TaxID=1156394 RepID=T0S621_SAPDV|nr:hypothetical protein SDRG_02423 [Saprolegnia diclina VS20]EQC40533.1 hypothetical protein SDRG_02423 [Saprolegnia diclina VS20]|eukprot:XP_008606232.1 hypothetical protein SDRG_02423 [Saprolegnia diclina VS20]